MCCECEWKERYQELANAVKQIPSLSGDYGTAMNSGITEHMLYVRENIVYDIQQALRHTKA